MDIPNTDSVNYAFASAQSQAMQYRHEFITPEHLLSALLKQVPFQKALAECFCTPGRTVPVHFRISVKRSGTSSSRNRI